MRRWLLIFLVVLLPMQLSWAAVASYCQHESAATTSQHVGHHEHQHHADGALAKVDTEPVGAHTPSNGAVDVDCGTCHAGCCTAMIPSDMLLLDLLSSETHSAPALCLSSQPASLPERPNWSVLA